MALFRRRSRSEGDASVEDQVPADGAQDEVLDGAADDTQGEAAVGYDRAAGPFDVTEADLADTSLTRIDLGSLRIPGLPGLGVQVEADRATNEVVAVTVVGEGAAVQLQAFAAPRTDGVWDDIRAEMLRDIGATAGARVREVDDGPFGPELSAVLPGRSPEGGAISQPVRFVGIDGPRWFLRAVFLGRAAVQPDPDDDLHLVVRQTIVVRGPEAMAPRDPLPLRLPTEAAQEAGDDEAGEDDAADEWFTSLDPFDRGPEITEVR